MQVLFDQGTPVPLRRYLIAEREGFEVLVTTDQNLKYQQNLSERRIAIVVLTTTSWPRIRRKVTHVVTVINSVKPGDYIEIDF